MSKMAGSHKLAKIISQINKSPILNNASTAIGNATERAQQKMVDIQTLASGKCKSIVQHVNGSTIIQTMQAAALEPSPPLPKRLVNWWQWYKELVGLDTVEAAKQNVINIQNTLFKHQEHRRELTYRVNVCNEKLKDIYSELLRIRRDDPKYVQLTIEENKNLQEQSKITEQLAFLEKEERDYFTQLATAIKEYHDSQNMNAQKYKYLSIVASISVGVLSLLGTMMYNNKRISDMNRSIAEAQMKNEVTFKAHFNSLEKTLGINLLNVSKQIDETNKSINWLSKDPGLKKYAKHVLNTSAIEEESPDLEKIKTITFYAGLGIATLFILNRIS